jgi:hypothetical protein
LQIITEEKIMKKNTLLLIAVLLCVTSLPGLARVVVEDLLMDVPVVEDVTPDADEAEENAESKPDTVTFLNGDRLKGLLVSVEPQKGGMTWQSPYSVKPIDMSLESVHTMLLKPRGGVGKKWGTASIHLSNDDAVWGDIVAMDKDKLTLNTWYAGRLEFRRAMIARIRIQNKDSNIFYEGPNSMSEWTVGRRGNRNGAKAWEFKKGSLYGSQQAMAARKIKDMPDKVKIDFTMNWRGSYPGMAISFFNDNLTQQSDCYSITISGTSIYLYRYSRQRGSSNLGSANLQSLTRNGKGGARFSILADRNDKKVALMVDGELVKQWVDKSGIEHNGDVLMFYPQNQNGCKISDIRVSAWDGRIPVAGSEPTEKSVEDLIRLANGDKVSGKILTISEGAIKFRASYAEMAIPLNRIVEIVTAQDKRELARRNQFDSKFTLVNGGVITFDLKNIQSDEASGDSENFGSISFPLSAVREVECNLYADKPDADDASDF